MFNGFGDGWLGFEARRASLKQHMPECMLQGLPFSGFGHSVDKTKRPCVVKQLGYGLGCVRLIPHSFECT